MKILDLHIDGFGKFHNRDISFSDGLNIVYGKNEAGKSTLHTFIRGMLFGIERQRGRASRNDTYTKYEPWTDSGTYEGRMRIESGGQIYRIERRFQKGSKSLSSPLRPYGTSCAAACRRPPIPIPSASVSSNAPQTKAWWENCAIILPI